MSCSASGDEGKVRVPVHRVRRQVALLASCFLLLIGSVPAVAVSRPAGDGCPAGHQVILLLYHRFSVSERGSTTVRIGHLQSQIGFLSRRGYQFRQLDEVIAWRMRSSAVLPCRTAVITVDDDHRSTYELMLPLVRASRLPVTLFIYPSAISNASYALTWDQLRALRATGLFDVQSHTFWHPDFNADRKRMSPSAFRSYAAMQLGRSKAVIEARLGGAVQIIAWPFGIHDEQLDQLAAQQGYVAGVGISGHLLLRSDPLFGLPRVTMPDTGGEAVLARMMSRLEFAVTRDGPP